MDNELSNAITLLYGGAYGFVILAFIMLVAERRGVLSRWRAAPACLFFALAVGAAVPELLAAYNGSGLELVFWFLACAFLTVSGLHMLFREEES